MQHLQRSLNMAKATSIATRPVFHYFSGLSGWFAKSSLQIICLNNKIHFFFAGAIKSPCYQGKLYEIKAFTHSQQQTHLWIRPVGMGGAMGGFTPPHRFRRSTFLLTNDLKQSESAIPCQQCNCKKRSQFCDSWTVFNIVGKKMGLKKSKKRGRRQILPVYRDLCSKTASKRNWKCHYWRFSGCKRLSEPSFFI